MNFQLLKCHKGIHGGALETTTRLCSKAYHLNLWGFFPTKAAFEHPSPTLKKKIKKENQTQMSL